MIGLRRVFIKQEFRANFLVLRCQENIEFPRLGRSYGTTIVLDSLKETVAMSLRSMVDAMKSERKKDQNYYSTFIRMAEDSKAQTGVVPEAKNGKETIASLQYKLISENPYRFTQEDILFDVYALRQEIPKSRLRQEREKFFSKGQPCLRTSPLCKSYGWGIHSDKNGRVALYAMDSKEYSKFAKDKNISQTTGMRSAR